DTASFFSRGTSAQFDYVLALYPQVLKLKAENKCKKPDELIRLDDWYQNKLPQLIKKRGKDQYMVHEELVQTMKWKQTRGKFYPQLSYLIKVNTPRAVQAETKKAFRKLPNLEQAITALSNLKGVGTTMASALLAAAAPETAPFMADECLMAIPEIEGIDYTTREYLNFVQHIQVTTDRLNRECHPTDSTPEQTGSSDGSISSKKTGNGTSATNVDSDNESSSSSDEDSTSVTPAKKVKPDTSSATLSAREKKWSPHKIPEAETVRASSNDQSKIVSSCDSSNKDSKSPNGNTSMLPIVGEEPSDDSNFDTEHGKSVQGSDDSSKDHKFTLDNLDDGTKSDDSIERPKSSIESCGKAANTSSRCVAARDDSISSPKPSIDEAGIYSDQETSSPPGKKTKFG
uniref:Uncharacterized protein n=1 Tax=Anopheles dirus TaxID=7168 RepID=A0A182NRV8_9DIPT